MKKIRLLIFFSFHYSTILFFTHRSKNHSLTIGGYVLYFRYNVLCNFWKYLRSLVKLLFRVYGPDEDAFSAQENRVQIAKELLATNPELILGPDVDYAHEVRKL